MRTVLVIGEMAKVSWSEYELKNERAELYAVVCANDSDGTTQRATVMGLLRGSEANGIAVKQNISVLQQIRNR